MNSPEANPTPAAMIPGPISGQYRRGSAGRSRTSGRGRCRVGKPAATVVPPSLEAGSPAAMLNPPSGAPRDRGHATQRGPTGRKLLKDANRINPPAAAARDHGGGTMTIAGTGHRGGGDDDCGRGDLPDGRDQPGAAGRGQAAVPGRGGRRRTRPAPPAGSAAPH